MSGLADETRTGALSVRMAESVLGRFEARQMRWSYRDGFLLAALARVAEHWEHEACGAFVRDAIGGIVGPEGEIASYRREDYDLDQVFPGNILFGLYARSGDPRYRKALDHLRMQLRRQPRTRSGGFWRRRASPDQMWLGGVYMAIPFYARYASAAGDVEDFHDVAHQVLLMEERARDPATGLLCHAWDESRRQLWANPETGRSPSCWGRAMGWFAMALVDVLECFPALHPDRGGLVAALERLAAAVLRYQDPDSGMWHQVVDKGGIAANYIESSATCMFAYTLLKGARMGFLAPETCLRAADRALRGVRERFIETDPENVLSMGGISATARLGGTPLQDGSFSYYCGLDTLKDDPRGSGAFILASTEAETAEPARRRAGRFPGATGAA